jgi:hypothetical protein
LAAGGIAVLARSLAKFLRIPTLWTGRALTLFGVLAALYPNSTALTVSPKVVEQKKYAPYPFTEALSVAKKLKEISQPEDRILIAGSEPEILYYSKRRSSTRFTIVYPLIIPTELAAPYQEQAIQQIERNPPQFVIHARNKTSWLFSKASPTKFPEFIEQLVKRDYTPVAGIIKSDSGGDWVDNPDPSKMDSCIIVLYKKNASAAVAR